MLQDELNKNPFTVPENYFDRLPMNVQERCVSENEIKSSSVWSSIKPRLAYIGGFAALALIAYGGFSTIGNSTNNNHIANKQNPKSVSASSFVNNNAQLANTSPFIQILDNKNTKSGINMDEDIIDYLALENISVDDILDLAY